MSFLVTGGRSELALKILKRFKGSHSVSRSEGYDIANREHRFKIADLSLKYPYFLNNAFDGPPHEPWADLGQVRLLQEVYETWKEDGKKGHIINIGSMGSHYPIEEYDSHEAYRVAKATLDEASAACSRAFLSNQVPFKTTLIRVGRMDSKKNREKPTWTGNGVSLDDLVDFIAWSINGKPNGCVISMDIDVNLHMS